MEPVTSGKHNDTREAPMARKKTKSPAPAKKAGETTARFTSKQKSPPQYPDEEE